MGIAVLVLGMAWICRLLHGPSRLCLLVALIAGAGVVLAFRSDLG